MLSFYCPINSTGYGVHSYNLLKEVDKLGIELALYPVNNQTEYTNPLIDKWLENRNKFSKGDIGVMIYHEGFMNRFYGSKRIGFPVFEIGLLQKDIEMLKTLDYIFQTSHYFKDYLISLGFQNVYVVPEGYDPNIFKFDLVEISKKEKTLSEKGIVFSHVGKFEERKSSADILKVFTYALVDLGINCSLIVSMINPFLLNNGFDIIKNNLIDLGYSIEKDEEGAIRFVREKLRVVVMKYKIRDIRELYNISHFGIYPSKAEGWNLPLIESIASGVPCITTDWTGQSEYLKNYPKELIIEKGQEVVANDGIWFKGDRGKWICPNLISFKEILRNVVNNPIKYLNLASTCYNSVKEFTWANSARIFKEFLEKRGLM